ncbi:hypothetical protein DD238_003620 [Peronospora effusa]|uniref:BAP29/BAP31 transmembrane domain-containing protein n=1 Tax=Peronospora effusa TaxID=542832 RepID=A0A3M6VH85_9STRA|nr:hypothetical protein DD238_003620 [Peronospora effusa]RQM15682.1 hypothetical protein DD237_004046 [Peronospora effusa]
MTIPFPGLMLNRGVVKFGDFVFNIRIGTLSIFSVITAVSFVVLAAQTYDLQKRMLLRFHAMKKQLIKAQRHED